MPRYYFDVFDGERFWADEFGEEMADGQAAREQAQALLPHLAREKLLTENSELRVVVRGSDGQGCYEATLTIEATWIEPPCDPQGAPGST